MNFEKSLDVILSQALLYTLDYAIIRYQFFQNILYLNIPNINYPASDARSLNQHQFLNPVEPDFLPASCGSIL